MDAGPMRFGTGSCLALALAVVAGAVVSAQPPIPAGPLTYDQALALASSRNLNVEAARRARLIREAAIRTARQIPNPDVSFEATQDVPHQGLSVDIPVELGGKRSRRIDLAKEELTLAEVDVQAELRAVRRELRQAFYGLIAADERVRLADSLLDIARGVRDAAQARFDTGAAPRLEVLQADLGVTRAETDLELARSIRVSSQATLDAVLNLPPRQALAVAGTLYEHAPVIAYEQALAIATASNVDLVLLDRQIAVEARRLDLLRAERTPTPVFSAGALFNAPGEFDVASRFAVSVGVPIFSRNQGEIAGSIATGAQLRTRREATLRIVENQVYGTIARVEAARRQVEAYDQRLVPTATDLQTLAEESYRAGRTSVLGLLDAQRSLRDLRREGLQAALDLQIALADLEEVLGRPIQ
ncbi:MAG TPA: TolC family protein [Vicinamibacterales bacterium]|nr:TolC family protein [Vicinamibacterales bacterium]